MGELLYEEMPRKLRIGFQTIRVEVMTPELAEARGIYGQYDSYNRTISLAPNLASDQLTNTFIHEVLHGIWQVFDLYSIDPADPEETCVTRFVNGLVGFWRDNNDALIWFTKAVQGDYDDE